jgi:hypothetical protein
LGGKKAKVQTNSLGVYPPTIHALAKLALGQK